MRTETMIVAGSEITYHVVEREQDFAAAECWIGQQDWVAFDTETTGLNTFAADFRVHCFQFGNETESYVVPAQFKGLIRFMLDTPRRLVAHNLPYDALVSERHGVADALDLAARGLDTKIMSHICDSSSSHGLKDLAARLISDDCPDSDAALKAVFKENKWKVAEGYAHIPSDHPVLLRYGAVDTILTARLFVHFREEMIERRFKGLLKFDMDIQRVCLRMERKGILLDVPRTEANGEDLRRRGAEATETLRSYGIEKVNSPAQVGEVLVAMGATLTERTDGGQFKVDKLILQALITAHEGEFLAEVAEAVSFAKNAGKWNKIYVEGLLEKRDENDRIHAHINSQQARTARMSITDPPLQTLPSSVGFIREQFLADPGFVMVSCDFDQVEVKVAAALSKDRALLTAVNSGMDIHSQTAAGLFGPDFTKAQRSIAKTVTFGRLYGAGVRGLVSQTGQSTEVIKSVVNRFDTLYPGLKMYGKQLERGCNYGAAPIINAKGRHLKLSRDASYAAINYQVQSSARDAFGTALLNAEDAGLGDYMLLPVHDEIICQFPEADVEECNRLLKDTMEMEFDEVRLTADPEVLGERWYKS